MAPSYAPPRRATVIQGFFPGKRPHFQAPHQRAATVQLSGRGTALQVPPSLLVLRPGGAGQRLPEAVQKKMEAFFQADLSDVRIHVGPQAASIGAVAFTHGTDIYFAHGQYDPTSAHGQRLLGHELTHVIQQRAGRVRNPFGSGVAVVQDPLLEGEAESMGAQAAAARAVPPGGPAGGLCQPMKAPLPARQPAPPAITPPGVRPPAHGIVQRVGLEDLPDELIVYILHFLGAEYIEDPEETGDVKAQCRFALTARRYFALAHDNSLPLIHAQAGARFKANMPLALGFQPPSRDHLKHALTTYPNALEATLHGAHMHTPRLGFVGTATVVALLVDGVPTPLFWSEDIRSLGDTDEERATAIEKEVKQRIESYLKLYPAAQNAKFLIGDKELASQSKEVLAAKAVKPSSFLKKLLVQNESRSRPPLSFNPWENQKLRYQETTYRKLFKVQVGAPSYLKLAGVDKEYGEEDSYGHSEQILAMSPRWNQKLRELVSTARLAIREYLIDARTVLPSTEITLLLNRSPCTACSSYLVVELENFWKLLANNLYIGATPQECKRLFSGFFAFKIVFSSYYKKREKSYPHDVIWKALTQAGWILQKVNELSGKEKTAGTCISGLTIEPPDKRLLEAAKRKRQQMEKAEEFRPSKSQRLRLEQSASTIRPRSTRAKQVDYRRLGGENEEEEEKGK